MWYCSSCGTGNEDLARFCVECGQPRSSPDAATSNIQPMRYAAPNVQPVRSAVPNAQPVRSAVPNAQPVPPAAPNTQPAWAPPPQYGSYAPPPPQKKKSRWWLWLILGLAFLATVAVVCFFTIHKWTPATCTEPETCSICGKTRGTPLGHVGTPATCTEPFICTRCGETAEPALGHNWIPATYDDPKTCARCGLTEGDPKGWVGDLEGHVAGDQALYLYGNGESHPYILDRVIENCLHMTLYIRLTDVDGDPYGTWGLYGRDLDGTWHQIATFTVTSAAYLNYVSFDLTPSGLPTFDALSTVPLTDKDYNISYSFYYEDVQEFVG